MAVFLVAASADIGSRLLSYSHAGPRKCLRAYPPPNARTGVPGTGLEMGSPPRAALVREAACLRGVARLLLGPCGRPQRDHRIANAAARLNIVLLLARLPQVPNRWSHHHLILAGPELLDELVRVPSGRFCDGSPLGSTCYPDSERGAFWVGPAPPWPP